jgi:hypothetical protein
MRIKFLPRVKSVSRASGLRSTSRLVWLSVAALTQKLAAIKRDDRGNALVTATITVGLLLIAAIVLSVLRDKGVEIANNVCTNADPSTC